MYTRQQMYQLRSLLTQATETATAATLQQAVLRIMTITKPHRRQSETNNSTASGRAGAPPPMNRGHVASAIHAHARIIQNSACTCGSTRACCEATLPRLVCQRAKLHEELHVTDLGEDVPSAAFSRCSRLQRRLEQLIVVEHIVYLFFLT